jgi:hypothetical protein
MLGTPFGRRREKRNRLNLDSGTIQLITVSGRLWKRELKKKEKRGGAGGYFE